MLNVENLSVNIINNKKTLEVLSNVSFSIDKNQTFGLVGESGCGKSMTATAIMGLLRNNIKIVSGNIYLDEANLTNFTQDDYENIRGDKISMIFQDSMSSLNPLIKVGKQIEESYKIHYNLSKIELKERVYSVLHDVGFENVEETYNKYPHKLSGGQRQRIMIAMAIALHPDYLIADEPTTALDVTNQNKILKLISNIQKKNNMGIMFISHDIKVINKECTHVGVMYAGKIVECGEKELIIKTPKHPYTKALIESIPRVSNKNKPLNSIDGFVPALGERKANQCIFYNRCKYRSDKCLQPIKDVVLDDGRKIQCTLYYND